MTDAPLRVMIADDEAAARRFLARQVRRCPLVMELVGQAHTGPQLLSKLEDGAPPDILLLDIMMPGFTGLEALRKLKRGREQMKVVVISAYDRFDFAQEALKLGVDDFLLKPLRPAELLAAVARCGDQIANERAQERQNRVLAEKAHAGRLEAQSTLVGDILARDQESDHDALRRRLSLLGFGQPQAVMLAEAPRQCGHELKGSIPSWVDKHPSIWSTLRPGRVALLPWDGAARPAELESMARSLLRHLRESVPTECAESVRVAHAGPTRDLAALPGLYESASLSLNVAYVTGQSLVGSPTEDDRGGAPTHSIFRLESRLAEEMRLGSPQTALALLNDLVEQSSVARGSDPRSLMVELVAAITVACRVASQHLSEEEELLRLRNSAVSSLMGTGATGEMVQAARECIEDIFSRYEEKADNRQRVVAAAQAVIGRRVGENLSLCDVAAEVFVSPYYLSHLFKDVSGVSFQEYLTSVRIERAKELLRNTDLACQTIGQEVGYSSASYFSQIFKRHTGQSPAEFRGALRRAMSADAADPVPDTDGA